VKEHETGEAYSTHKEDEPFMRSFSHKTQNTETNWKNRMEVMV